MKASEIRDMSMDEMQAKARDLKEELFNLRFRHAIEQLEAPHKLRQVRRDISRVYTIIRETEKKQQADN
jgi:large subunit ribosomal protein L29